VYDDDEVAEAEEKAAIQADAEAKLAALNVSAIRVVDDGCELEGQLHAHTHELFLSPRSSRFSSLSHST